MKLAKKILSACLVGAFSVSLAQADVTVYITGATAYRTPAIASIKAYLTGGYVGIYGAKSGVTSESNAANAAFRGTRTENPALGTITIKCAWGGSVGGVKLIQSTTSFNIDSQPGVKGWIPDAALPAGNSGGTIFAGTEGSTTIIGADSNTYTFESGVSAAKPDAAFSDCLQSTALGGSGGDAVGLGSNGGKIAVIPFNVVVSNGVTPSSVTVITLPSAYTSGVSVINYTSTTGAALATGKVIGGKGITPGTTITAFDASTITLSAPTTAAGDSGLKITAGDNAAAPFDNITVNQLNQVITNGLRLSAFTGLNSDNTKSVYAYGRNSDSGTRISQMGESGKGVTQRPGAHLIPTISGGSSGGKGGLPSRQVTALAKWSTETVLGVTYLPGQGGYSSGGDLKDALTSYGAQLVTPTGYTRPGWMIGYVGRSDAAAATATTFGHNTAKRLTFNGQKDWNGTTFTDAGVPTAGYNDTAIKEGNYQLWEYENFFRKSTSTGDKQTVLDSLAASMEAAAAPSGSIKLSEMNAARTIEGGPISY